MRPKQHAADHGRNVQPHEHGPRCNFQDGLLHRFHIKRTAVKETSNFNDFNRFVLEFQLTDHCTSQFSQFVSGPSDDLPCDRIPGVGSLENGQGPCGGRLVVTQVYSLDELIQILCAGQLEEHAGQFRVWAASTPFMADSLKCLSHQLCPSAPFAKVAALACNTTFTAISVTSAAITTRPPHDGDAPAFTRSCHETDYRIVYDFHRTLQSEAGDDLLMGLELGRPVVAGDPEPGT